MNYSFIRLYGDWNNYEGEPLYKDLQFLHSFLAENSNLEKVKKHLDEFIEVFNTEKNYLDGKARGLKELINKSALIREYINNDWDRHFFDHTDIFCRLYYVVEDLSNCKIFEN